MIFLEFLGIVFLLYLMYKSADYLVTAASAIAKYFKVSDLVIGLTVVAIGTSAPELVVSMSSAAQGSGDISVANIVGSNIYNLGVILGLVALMTHMKISNKILYRDVLFLAGLSLFQGLFFLDGVLDRMEGLLILVTFLIWLGFVFKSTNKNEIDGEEIPDKVTKKELYKYIWVLAASLIVLVGSGHFMVELATSIARTLGVSEWLIGLTIVGIGTSTPELITSIVALKKGSHGISLGNLFGSDIFNQGFVLALVALFFPIVTTGDNSSSGFFFITAYVGFLFLLMFWDKKLSKREGLIILTVVSARFIWEIWKGLS